MIQITPYYRREDPEKTELLELFLSMISDVVPFLPEDVLAGTTATPSEKSKRAKNRTKRYLKLLAEYKIPSVSAFLDTRQQDAILARRMIESYSTKLHIFLYDGISRSSGRVHQKNLRALLTVQLRDGELDETMNFRPEYDRLLSRKKEGKSEAEKNLEAELKQLKQLLKEYVFCYDALSEHSAIYSYLQKLNVGVCPYCNRQYITTVSDDEKRTRPQLDHFKNKNDYPFLAISINNLIPSCGVCNLLKHDNDTSLLYPYEEGIGDLYFFETDDLPGTFTKLREGALRAPEEFDINLTRTVGPGNEAGDRAENSIREFALKKLYQSHKGYITAMYYQRYIHTDEFCEDLVRQFPFLAREKSDPNDDLPLNEEEITLAKEKLKKALYLMDYSQERWGDRPLAKLTHDIAEEIERRARGIK